MKNFFAIVSVVLGVFVGAYIVNPTSAHAASRYWVGGTGSWSDTSHWAETSGGAGGASVPTITDDAFFDGSSGGGTLTITANALVRDLDFTGYTGTYSGGNVTMTLAGSLTISSGMTVTSPWFLFVATSGTKNITSNGKSLGTLDFNGAGGSWQLQDALTATSLNFYAGTFSTNNYAVAVTNISLAGRVAATVNLGSSTVTISSSLSGSSQVTPVTFNAGTSHLVFTSGSPSISASSLSFYDVSFTSISSTGSVVGAHTFHNFSISNTATKNANVLLDSDLTISGTLTMSGNSATNRPWIRSTIVGTARTLTAAAVSLSNMDFRDIAGAGAASWTGTSLGDVGGNTGITFDASVTRYAVAAGNWSATSTWSTSSGGAAGASVPLPQDDIFLDASSGAGTYTIDMPRPGRTLDATGFTRTLSFSSVSPILTGGLTLSSGMTLSGFTMSLVGRSAYSITSNGKAFPSSFTLTIEAPGGTYTLQDAISFGSGSTLTLNNGELNTNSQSVSVATFNSSGGITSRTLTLGSTSWTGTSWTSSNSGLTLNAGTSSVTLTGNFTMSDAVTLNSLTVTGTGTNFTLGANLTVSNTLSINGNSANNRILFRSNTHGTTRTVTAGAVSLSNIDFRDITGAGAASWTGTNMGDSGGNSNITFTGATTRYAVSAGNWQATSTWSTSSGGAAGASVPLPQDNVIFDASSGSGSYTANAAGSGCSNLTMTGFTGTLAATSLLINGNLTIGSGTTITNGPTFSGRGSQTITTNGRSMATITIDAPGGTYTLQDALTLTSTLTLTAGTFNANNYDISATGLSSSGSLTRALTMGSGTWTMSGTSPWSVSGTGLTITPNTSTIKITNTSASTKTFAGNGVTYNNVWITGSGTGAYTISGSNTFNELRIDTPPHTVNFTASTTQTVATLAASSTAGNLITLQSLTKGSPWSLVKSGGGTSILDYLLLRDSVASPSDTWYAGLNSTDVHGNSGWSFTAGPSSNTAPTATIGTPAQVSASNTISFTATLADVDNNTTTLQIQYSTDGSTWASSTLGSVTGSTTTVSTVAGQISNIGTNTGTTTLTIAWLAGTDLADTYDASVYLRIKPYDGTAYASSFSTSTAFSVDTRTAATPTGLSGFTSGRDTVNLSWTGTNPTYLITNVTAGTTTTTSSSSYTVSSLSCYTNYTFTVSGISFTGSTSSASSELTLRTRECGSGGGGGGGSSGGGSSASTPASTPSVTTTQPPLVLAPSADPAEIARLQLLINDLKRQIAARQQTQNQQIPISVTTGVSAPTRNLVSGQVNADVKLLQKALNTLGFTVSTTGPGSVGNETTKFGPATRAALIRFQIAQGIITSASSDGAGMYGPKTRKALEQALLGR